MTVHAESIYRQRRLRACGLCMIVFGLGMFLPAAAQPPASSSIRFRDIASEAGITKIPYASPEMRYLLETMGGGVGLLDCDGDGKLDIVAVNGSTVSNYLHGGDPMITLYHQGKDLHFTDITKSAGLTTKGWGMGVAIGDFNNDGLPDIYVTGYGHNVLYQNMGDCKFKDVTAHAGVAGGGFSVGAAWADYDRDGNLDLFVSRYVNTDIHNLPKPGSKVMSYHGLPLEVPISEGESDLLFHNRGDGTFEEVSVKAGVSNPDKRLGMGVVWGDDDNDGWPDLFVSNDQGPNFLYHNQHNGTFVDEAMLLGVALSQDGHQMGNMAGDFGDYDRDGMLDLVVTRYGYQPMSLFHNIGANGFEDATWKAKIDRTNDSPVRWGSGFADFDNDGWPDIFVATGNVSPLVDQLPNELKYREPIQLYHNHNGHYFEEIANKSGLNDGPLQSRRGTAVGDIYNDGNVDVVVYNEGDPPSVFLNETKNLNYRVLFRLVGTKSNREAIGARMTVTTSKMTQIDEVRGGGSYLSSNDPRLHFGLGQDAEMKKVEIQWPSGQKDVLENVPGDAIYTIVEGKGIVEAVPFESVPLFKPAQF